MKCRIALYNCLTIWLLASMASCAMMETDRSDCPTGHYITFKYDYNIQRSDMFNDHVGGVTVYVFDENDCFVAEHTEENISAAGVYPLKQYGYKMRLDLPDGKYKCVAIAHQRSAEEVSTRGGAKYHRPAMSRGDDINSLQFFLDRETDKRPIDGSEIAVVPNNKTPMDTLWHAMSTTIKESKTTKATYDTLSLTRNTNHLTLSLRQLDDEANIDENDFDAYIIDKNGTLNHDNTLADDEDIYYYPYDSWMTDFKDPDGNVIQRAAHYGIDFSRLIYNADPSKNAILIVRNKKTGKNVAAINLPDCLAQARSAVERYNYTPQEFLDREYNYKLTFFLKGDTWSYIDLSISLLSWSMRLQNLEF